MPRPRAHTLLIVDDERQIVESLHGLFRRDYTLHTTTSAREALEILRREKVHVVLSDQRMPEMSGAELLTKVREISPMTVRILVTGYADVEAVIEAVNRGQIYGYVSKPWKTEELELLVGKACEHHDLFEHNSRLLEELQAANRDLERVVEERTRQLASLERYKDCIIANLQSGLMVVGPDLTIETINYAGAVILRHPVAGPGQTASGGPLAAHDQARVFLEAVRKTLQTGVTLDYQEAVIKEGLELRHIGFGTSPLVDQDGQRRGVIVIFRDTTDKRRMEEQLIQAEKLAAIGELAGGIAHEINNPLGVILGFTQLILKGTDAGQPSHRRLKQVEEQALRCKTIVANLLKFARKSRVDSTLVNVGSALGETLDLLGRQLEVENIRVDRQLSPTPLLVRANENEIQQVFFNLIINAKDAMAGGGTLTIEATADDSRVRVRISDTGRGIPPEIKARIFAPFFTTKPAGKGTGLGLSISHGLVTKFGGTIEVDSLPGRGTTFEICFPVGKSDDTAVAPQEAVAPRRESLRGLRVLAVDDEEDILNLYRELLTEDNEVEAFSDPRAALERARQKEFDLVLLDMLMPGMDGQEFLEGLHGPAGPAPDVIVVTGCASDTVARLREQAGVFEVLAKPFTLVEVEEAIRKAWEKRRVSGRPTR